MIQLHSVSKTFAGSVDALRDVSLRIGKGELLLLTGASGAGKTTLLRTIFAAERPDRGRVFIAGRDITRLRSSSIPYLRRNVGVVFQDFQLLKSSSVLQNVGLALEIRGRPRAEVRQRCLEMLESLGLGQLAHTPVETLSGGEQQRVAIARALVGKPAILLADEPTGNLDPAWSADILTLLNQICEQGTTVVVATHDPVVVQKAAFGQLIQLEKGRVARVPLGSPEPLASVDPPRPASIQPVALPPVQPLDSAGAA